MNNLKLNTIVYILKSFGLSGTSGLYFHASTIQKVTGVVVKDLGEFGKELYVSHWNIKLFLTKQSYKEWKVEVCSHSRRLLTEKFD